MLKKNITVVLNLVIAALMLAILVCQFAPFWAVNGDQSSLMGMTGRQYNHEAMIETLNEQTGGFSYLDISTNVLVTIVVAAFGAVMAAKNNKSAFNGVFGAIVAVAGILLWLQVPAYKLGKLAGLLFVLDILLLAISAVLVVLYILKLIGSFKKK